MEALQVGQKLFRFADAHGRNVNELMSRPDFGESVSDLVVVGNETMMMSMYWQLAAGLTKEMTEPLKSIVNK